MTTIKSIREFTNWKPSPHSWSQYDGYTIETEEGTWVFGIDNSQSCCESWGYLVNEQDLQKFYGANMIGMRKTTEDRQVADIEYTHTPGGGWSLDDGDVVFVDLVTDRGTVQFAAYNSHNGYYGHDVKLWYLDKPLLDEGV